MENKIRRIWEGITYSVEHFCLTVLKQLAGEPSRVPKNAWRKPFHPHEGEHHCLIGYFLVSQWKKELVGGNLVFQKRSVKDKSFLANKEGITIFRRIFFCLTVPKKISEEAFCVLQNSGNEKFYA